MKLKKVLLFPLFCVALVINPYLGCSNGESDFTYSEPEMKQVVLGSWEGTAEIGGESVPFSLVLEQATAQKTKSQSVRAPSVEPQCGTRSFIKPAAACIATTEMPVVGTLTSENPAFNGPVEGRFEAMRTLDSVMLNLTLEDGRLLYGPLSDQTITDGHIGREKDSFTLQRP